MPASGGFSSLLAQIPKRKSPLGTTGPVLRERFVYSGVR
jgi:hypothetical protein